MGPYIVDGHYMYGNTFCMPRPPYYNTICHHRAPAFRAFPPRLIADKAGDGVGYSEPEGYDQDGDCTHIVRSSSLPNVTAVTAKKITTLRIKIWGATTEEDYYVDLEIGSRYAITYLVPGGYAIADGYLEYIDSSISDDCTKYTGNYEEDVVQAYIGLDCSTTGNSDKRKIYISAIRKIEALDDDEEYDSTVTDDTDEESETEKMLKRIICMLDRGMIFMTDEDEPGKDFTDTDDLEVWDVGELFGKPHHKGNHKKDDDDESTDSDNEDTIADTLISDLNNLIQECRVMAGSTLLSEEVNEKKDNGTEDIVRRAGNTSDQLMLLASKISDYEMDLELDVDNYEEIDIVATESQKKIIVKKIAIIIRYINAISNGFGMVEE